MRIKKRKTVQEEDKGLWWGVEFPVSGERSHRKAPIWWRNVGTSGEPEGSWLHLQVHLAEWLG